MRSGPISMQLNRENPYQKAVKQLEKNADISAIINDCMS